MKNIDISVRSIPIDVIKHDLEHIDNVIECGSFKTEIRLGFGYVFVTLHEGEYTELMKCLEAEFNKCWEEHGNKRADQCSPEGISKTLDS